MIVSAYCASRNHLDSLAGGEDWIVVSLQDPRSSGVEVPYCLDHRTFICHRADPGQSDYGAAHGFRLFSQAHARRLVDFLNRHHNSSEHLFLLIQGEPDLARATAVASFVDRYYGVEVEYADTGASQDPVVIRSLNAVTGYRDQLAAGA